MTPQERDRLYRAIRSRLKQGDSLYKFSERNMLGHRSMYDWMRGPSDPRWESMRRVADGLDMRMWELVREVEDGGVIRAFGPRRGER